MALCCHETEGTKSFLLNNTLPKDPARNFIPIIFGDIENFKNSEIPNTDLNNFLFGAALAGRVDIFEEAELRSLSWRNPQVMNGALFGGHLDILKWMVQKGLPPVEKQDFLDACAFRVVVGEGDAEGALRREKGRGEGGGREEEREDRLRWLSEQEYTWSIEPTKFAGAEGRTEYFDFATCHGLPLDISEICVAAATGAEWEPWNEGNIRVLKWVKKKGFTCKPETEGRVLLAAAKRKDHKVLRWLLMHGFKFPENEDFTLSEYFSRAPGKMSREEYDEITQLENTKKKKIFFNF
jgi:hypothetical protein